MHLVLEIVSLDQIVEVLNINYYDTAGNLIDKPDTARTAKYLGGQRNEVDAARQKHITEQILGADALDSVVIGASHRFRIRLLEHAHEALGDECGFDPAVIRLRNKANVDTLPPHLRGLPKPAVG